MKKYLYLFSKKCLLLTGILLLMFPSCNEDILEEVPLDFLSPEVAYKNIAGIEQGMNGLYFNVRSKIFTRTGGMRHQDVLESSLATDIAYHGENPGGTARNADYTYEFTPASSRIASLWENYYQLIQIANVYINGVNNIDEALWESDAQKNAYLAEGRFFRAYIYRFLVMLWGDVPLVTEVINTAKTDFVRAPKTEIFKLMEDDLTFAATYLPEPGKEAAPGRLTQGVAWHYLSEIYLSQSKFQLAVEAASKVIDGYHYALMTSRFGSTIDWFGSGDVFLDLFAPGNQNLKENTEAIWVIQFEPYIVGGSNYSDRIWGCAYYRMGNTPDGFKAFRGELVDGTYTGYSDTLGRGISAVRPTNYVVYDIWRSDWNNDIRNAKHNIKRDFYYDSPESIYDKKKIDFSLYPPGSRNSLLDTNSYIYPMFMKMHSPMQHTVDPARSGGGYHEKDKYVARLAETLLLRAEAYVGLGMLDLAAADINKIRSRANATPVLPADVNLDYICDERARELFGEEFRWITLRRMGNFLQRTRKYCNNPVKPACNVQDHHVLLPIPQKQIDLNIDAVFEQNPGY